MEKYLINFKNIEWESPMPGFRYKAYIKNNKKIRLVEFSNGFFEKEWCTSGHIGYILKGTIIINFSGKRIIFSEGDGIFISEGEKHKHKAEIMQGEKALIVLVEKI
jgi:quercetin dioxygenase-like cupin family protein